MSCNVRWMWIIIHGGEKLTVHHLTASEGRPKTWIQFIALFLWELWKLWDTQNPSPSHLLPELLILVLPMRDWWRPGLIGFFTLWGGVAGAGQGESGLGTALASTQPHRCLFTRAGHQSNVGEVRGCVNYLSVVLIQNLWRSCSWLKWGCRVVCGFPVMVSSISHTDLG